MKTTRLSAEENPAIAAAIRDYHRSGGAVSSNPHLRWWYAGAAMPLNTTAENHTTRRYLGHRPH